MCVLLCASLTCLTRYGVQNGKSPSPHNSLAQEGVTPRPPAGAARTRNGPFSSSVLFPLVPIRHVVHALLEGHDAAKASGLSQKNPVEQVRGKQYSTTRLPLCDLRTASIHTQAVVRNLHETCHLS